jgi:hypothetical protein
MGKAVPPDPILTQIEFHKKLIKRRSAMGIKPVLRYVFTLTATFFFICASVHAATIDFELLEHGEIVNSQYDSTDGVRIDAVNIGGGPNLAIAFDSAKSNTMDPDLEAPFAGGNLSGEANLGKMLIIAENSIDSNGDGLVDNPDDEGSNPAGSIFLDFDTPVTAFGFDIVDVEIPEESGRAGYSVQFFMGDNELASIDFESFVDPESPLYDPTVSFGDNHANRIDQIVAAELGVDAFDGIAINFDGSAAIDNLTYTNVPLPPAIILLGTGLFGLAGIRRKRSKK